MVNSKIINDEGVLYIAISLTDPGIIKIGSTLNFEQRMRQIKKYREDFFEKDMQFIPYYAIQTKNCRQLESILKSVIDSRIGNTECFRIEADKVLPLFQSLDGEQILPEKVISQKKYKDFYVQLNNLMMENTELNRFEAELLKCLYDERERIPLSQIQKILIKHMNTLEQLKKQS